MADTNLGLPLTKKDNKFFNTTSDEILQIIKKIKSKETEIYTEVCNFNHLDVKLKIESGALLNNLKFEVNNGKRKGYFETVVSELFAEENGQPFLGKTIRSERMKVARLKDAPYYAYLGWTKLVILAEVINDTEDEISSFLKKINFKIENHKDDNSKEFGVQVKTFYFDYVLMEEKIIGVSRENINIAVRRRLKFDKQLLEKLKKSPNPNLLIRASNEFDVTEKTLNEQKKFNLYGELEEQMEKLIRILSSVNSEKNSKQYLEHIQGYTFEDLAHCLGESYTLAGYRS